MNAIQRFALKTIGPMLGLETKKVGNQVPLTGSWTDGRAVLQEYSIHRAVEQDMKQNPFLYTALRKKAEAIASVPFYVEEFKDGVWTRAENHPAENLIEAANPFMSGFELKKYLVYHKELAGSAYWQIVLSKGEPVFFQPLFPQNISVIPDQLNFIKGFEYRMDGQVKKNFKPGQVFWTKYAHPVDPYQGLSPLAAISGELQTDIEARKWNKVSLSHRGATDAVFIMKDIQSEDDYDLARRMVEDKFSGPENARRPWIIGGDSDVRPLSYTALEMDFVDTRKFNREVIAAAIGVPAPLIGDADNSTYNNLDTLKRVFWEDTVMVFLEELRQDLTRQVLLPYFGTGRKSRPALRYMYDLSNVEALQQNMKEKADIAKVLAEIGFNMEQINNRLELQMDMDLATDVEGENETMNPPALEEDNEEARWVAELEGEFKRRLYDIEPDELVGIIESTHEQLCKELGTTPDMKRAHNRGVMLGKYLDGLIETEGREAVLDVFADELAPKLARVELAEARA